MISPKSGRFSDREDYKMLLDREGFSHRKSALICIMVIYSFIIAVVVTLAVMGYYSWSRDSSVLESKNMPTSIPILLLILMGGVAWFALRRLKQMLVAAEFQNVIFSNVIRLQTAFCIVINHQNKIIYANDDFRKIFKEQYERGKGIETIDLLFMHQGLNDQDKERVLMALKQRYPESVSLDLMEKDILTRKLTVKVNPIDRPRGYYIIRAYDRV